MNTVGDADPRVSEVRAAVAVRDPVDAREARSRERFLVELDRLARPLDEHADNTHVTASAIVVSKRGTLLHLHKRLGVWMQPGGHVEDGETPESAVLREVAEETGLSAHHPCEGPRMVHVDVHPGARGHVHLDLRYLLECPADDPSPREGESPHVAWFGWDEAIAIADPGLVGALRLLRT